MFIQLIKNNGPNALHGGLVGLDKVVWKATAESESVIFSYLSADGDEGYPGGNVQCKVKNIK